LKGGKAGGWLPGPRLPGVLFLYFGVGKASLYLAVYAAQAMFMRCPTGSFCGKKDF
jgi:hypothetical protein